VETQRRKVNIYLGNIVYEVPRDYNLTKGEPPDKLEVSIRDTNFTLPFTIKNDDFHLRAKMLIFDSSRNLLICNDVAQKVKDGYKCLVLTERREHVEVLNHYLRRDFEVIALTGDLNYAPSIP
jgi:superfamily II DNA or RNA helicase